MEHFGVKTNQSKIYSDSWSFIWQKFHPPLTYISGQLLMPFIIFGMWRDIHCYQSINQTSVAPISPVKPGSVARQPNQCSTAKSRKQFRNINRSWEVTVFMGKRPNQRDVSSDIFLKVATELAEQTDSGRLFKGTGAQEWKALAPVLVLTLGTDKLLSLFDLSERKEVIQQAIQFK